MKKRILAWILAATMTMSTAVSASALETGSTQVNYGIMMAEEIIDTTVPQKPTLLAPPVIQSVTQTGFYSNLVTWDPVPGAAYYKIVYKTQEMSAYKTLSKNVKGTSYEHVSTTAKPLKGGVQVYYKVIAVDENNLPGRYCLTPGTITMKTARNGLVMENGHYRYYENDVLQKKVWKTIDGKTYFFGSKGNADRNGAYKIGGVYYIFGKDQCLLNPAESKIYTINGARYYVSPQGTAVSGWFKIKNKLYYFDQSGKKQTNTTVDHIQLSSNGSAVNSVETELKSRCMDILAKITNDSMTQSQKLRAVWNYVVGGNFRYYTIYPNLNEEGWQRKHALSMLMNKGGNCYGFACIFAALAAEIGYDPVVICGRVAGSRDHAADGMTRHSWVTINGLHYDPEAQYAGWMRDVYGSGSYWYTHTIQKRQIFKD